jgi:hypothetical protein
MRLWKLILSKLFSKKEEQPSYLDKLIQTQTSTTLEELQSFIKRWNGQYPVDRWWREKYNIPINSKRHQDTHIIDMRLDYEEDLFYAEIREQQRRMFIKPDQKYAPGRGDWLKKRDLQTSLSKNEVDDLFDSININDIREDGNEIDI